MNFGLRPAKESDLEFLVSLRIRTMNPHLEKVGLPIDKLSHQHRILFRFEDAKIISYKEVSIGLLKSYCDESGWNIVQVQISPEYQGKGIGAKLVRNILKQAEDEGNQITLSVLKGNPAKDLYERLGFLTISESDVAYTMRCKPNKKNHSY